MRLPGIALLLLLACLPGSLARADEGGGRLAAPDWAFYKSRFLRPDGRVIDDGNGGISHSEGQGYGMLLAVAADDQASFDLIWRWTREHLGVRPDGLLAWKWAPADPKGPLPDRNCAADGDVLVAWALLRAGQRWHEGGYGDAARAGLAAIKARLVREVGGSPVLLPGVDGFVRDGIVTVNLSYFVFPAFAAFAAIDPDPVWAALGESGRRLLRRARFTPARLPPDWLALSEPPMPARGFAPVFGYNAVRIALHLVWAGTDDPDLLGPFAAFWRDHVDAPPATWDLVEGTGDGTASAGVLAIAQLTRRARGDTAAGVPPPTAGLDYYATSLLLLAELAYTERFAP